MATNIYGHNLDSGGNVAVDFVWGNFPNQPNDGRVAGGASTSFGGGSGDHAWSATATLTPDLLAFTSITKTLHYGVTSDVPPDNHERVMAGYAAFPGNLPAGAKYIVTAASADGTTVSYTSQNNLVPGDVVTITGLPTSAFNLTSATVATADKVKFTVTNTATGTAITGAYGVATNVTNAAAEDGAYVNGTAYVLVPNVVGVVASTAVTVLAAAGLTATSASQTNSAKTITAISRTLGSTAATVTASGAGAAYPVGSKVTIASLTAGNAEFNGNWTVTGTGTNTITFTSTGTSAVSTSGLSVSGLTGLSGTVATQNPAAGAASVAAAAAATATYWA